jgi:hypothetical protein
VGDNLSGAQPAIQSFLDAHPDSRDFSALLRPSADQVLFGVAVHDDAAREAAERELRPVLGNQLCVVDARYDPQDLERARSDPALQVELFSGEVFSSGTGVSDDLQPVQHLGVVMITEELRRAADAHPAGLVEFEPSITLVTTEEKK